MIRYTSGDMFDQSADVRVNTVNCVGVMGAGVALAFKSRYPDMFRDYQKACKRGEVKPGTLHLWKTLVGEWIVNFPTKRDWREPSRYEDIDAGLIALKQFLNKIGHTRVTLPALGCGHGGLEWSRVSKMIEDRLSDVDSEIIVFCPQSSLDAGANVKSNDVNVEQLSASGIVFFDPGDRRYPVPLTGRSASRIFVKGNPENLNTEIFSVIVSNRPDDRELKAVSECVDMIARPGMSLMFNYGTAERPLIRKALENHAQVILCLADGILNFTLRKDLRDVWDESRVTIFSLSRPSDRWTPSASARVKELALTFARATLISDPEPMWLSRLLKKRQAFLGSAIFYLKYATESTKSREILRAVNAQPIGKNPATGKPNMHQVEEYFRNLIPTTASEPRLISEQPMDRLRIKWRGTIPSQKWLDFSTEILARLTGKGVELSLEVDLEADGVMLSRGVEEMRGALRQLGLTDKVEVEISQDTNSENRHKV